MVWRLCKTFKVRPTDSFFDGITSPEQAWLFTMVSQDAKEEYEDKLAFTEYLASFTNPEAVKQIREDRKKARPQTDEEFAEMVGGMFGRAPVFKDK